MSIFGRRLAADRFATRRGIEAGPKHCLAPLAIGSVLGALSLYAMQQSLTWLASALDSGGGGRLLFLQSRFAAKPARRRFQSARPKVRRRIHIQAHPGQISREQQYPWHAALSAKAGTEQQPKTAASTAMRNLLASADRHDPSSVKAGMRAALGRRRRRPRRGRAIVRDWGRSRI